MYQGAKWYPSVTTQPYTLIAGSEYDIVTSNNETGIPSYPYSDFIILDIESDQNPDKTLAVSICELKINSRNANIFVNTMSQDGDDVHVTFDYENNKFYWGECISCTNEMSDTDILYTYDTYITNQIEEYWNNCLFVLPYDENKNANIIWGLDPNPNTTKYRIYRAFGDDQAPTTNFIWIKEMNINYHNYIDQAVIENNDNVKFAYYYVKSLNGSTELYNTNTVMFPSNPNSGSMMSLEINVDWSNVLNLTSTSDNNPRLVWAPHPSINLDNYIIYRAISFTPLRHPEIYAVQIASIGSNVFEFIDYDVRFSGTS
ncbi:MAG: hypothetical protein K8H86_00375 [Ignavibacteriaceae bacterium]|nr:hypothetical protein [Ignavibacteriaceae bacterium]